MFLHVSVILSTRGGGVWQTPHPRQKSPQADPWADTTPRQRPPWADTPPPGRRSPPGRHPLVAATAADGTQLYWSAFLLKYMDASSVRRTWISRYDPIIQITLMRGKRIGEGGTGMNGGRFKNLIIFTYSWTITYTYTVTNK